MESDGGARAGDPAAWATDLLEALPDPILIADDRGHIVFVNAQLATLFGFERAELLGRPIEDLVPLPRRGAHREHVRGFGAAPKVRPMGATEVEGVRKDGETVVVDIALSPYDHGGRSCVVAAVRDTTERRRAEAARQEARREVERSRAEVASLIVNLPDLVVLLDPEGVVRFSNDALTPFGAVKFVGEPWLKFLPEDRRQELESIRDRVQRVGERVGFDLVGSLPDHGPYWLACQVGPVRQDGVVVGTVVIARDVTLEKELAGRVSAVERMASMGFVAAAVAHEINNPLAAVVTNLDHALLLVDGGAPVETEALRDALVDTRDAARRVRAISTDLRVFSHAQDDRLSSVDVREVVEATLRIALQEIRPRASLQRRLEPVPPALANGTRLGQVVLNLLVNAAQSIPSGAPECHQICVSTLRSPSGEVVIEIRDTGMGMSQEVLSRLFVTSFTTKPSGLGTGLGLPICGRLVKAMGGHIEVRSQPGEGSTFAVHLRPAGPITVGAAPVVLPRDPGRRRRIAVVDDEPIVLRAAVRALSRHYDVVTFEDPAAALVALTAGESFDLVVCDIEMPGLTGIELYDRLSQAAPGSCGHMAFMSGGLDPATRAFLDRVAAPMIAKPFDLAQLCAFVEEACGARRPPDVLMTPS